MGWAEKLTGEATNEEPLLNHVQPQPGDCRWQDHLYLMVLEHILVYHLLASPVLEHQFTLGRTTAGWK